MIKAAIFDVDGVLIDSLPSSYRVKTALFAQHGVNLATIPDPHGEQHKGSSFNAIMRLVKEFYPNIAINKDAFKVLMIKGIYDDLKRRGVVVDSGLLAFLDELRRHNIPCGVASAGLRDGVESKLQLLGIADYFMAVVSADDVAQHKPHPASYLMAAAKLGVGSKDCVVFEDSKAGIQAATSAGAKVIGFTEYTVGNAPPTNTVCNIDSWKNMTYARLRELTR